MTADFHNFVASITFCHITKYRHVSVLYVHFIFHIMAFIGFYLNQSPPTYCFSPDNRGNCRGWVENVSPDKVDKVNSIVSFATLWSIDSHNMFSKGE